jgi:hypothetical protein
MDFVLTERKFIFQLLGRDTGVEHQSHDFLSAAVHAKYLHDVLKTIAL